MEFIKNLQNKPEPVKKTIMWTAVFVIMIIIFSFWLVTFSSQVQNSGKDETATVLKKELPSAWQALKLQINSIKDLWLK